MISFLLCKFELLGIYELINFKQKTNNRSKSSLPGPFDLGSQKQNNMHFRDLIISVAVKAELSYWPVILTLANVALENDGYVLAKIVL